jgi:hypothetical protein
VTTVRHTTANATVTLPATPVTAPKAPGAPAAPAVPKDSVGDGTTFQSLDTKPAAQSTP